MMLGARGLLVLAALVASVARAHAQADGIYYTFDIGVDEDRADGSIKNLLPDISSSTGHSIEHARFFKVD